MGNDLRAKDESRGSASARYHYGLGGELVVMLVALGVEVRLDELDGRV